MAANSTDGTAGVGTSSALGSGRSETTTNQQLLATFRYAALNPVRAGICERAEEWFWSSFATSCGLATTFPFVDVTHVLSALDASPKDAAAALLGLVGDV
jgi:hypothetical protein